MTYSGSPISGAGIGLSEIALNAVTDKSGNFQILVEGSLSQITQLFIGKPGYISEFLYFQEQKCPDFLDVRLMPSEGGVYGRVTDEAGHPVTLFMMAMAEAGSKGPPRFGKYVDNDGGLFAVTEVPAGKYRMVVLEITDGLEPVSKRASLQVEIKKGFYFGELQVKLTAPQPAR